MLCGLTIISQQAFDRVVSSSILLVRIVKLVVEGSSCAWTYEYTSINLDVSFDNEAGWEKSTACIAMVVMSQLDGDTHGGSLVAEMLMMMMTMEDQKTLTNQSKLGFLERYLKEAGAKMQPFRLRVNTVCPLSIQTDPTLQMQLSYRKACKYVQV